MLLTDDCENNKMLQFVQMNLINIKVLPILWVGWIVAVYLKWFNLDHPIQSVQWMNLQKKLFETLFHSSYHV